VTNSEAARLVGSMFSQWYPSLVRYAWKATGSVDLAEDLVQEVFMRLYRELRNGKTIHEPKSWTLCVLRHEIGKEKRGQQKRQAVEDMNLEELPGPVQPDFVGIETDELTDLLAVLSRREEEVVLLRLASLKYREIAARLGISANAVNTLLARALRKLQKAVTRKANDSPISDHVERSVSKTLQ
jgi:RNA polymerase sigma-70 factor (ECF subfamily)